jgi:hypothetical protein
MQLIVSFRNFANAPKSGGTGQLGRHNGTQEGYTAADFA